MTGGLLSAAGGGASPLWYATRATGVVALVLLTGTVVLGIASTARFAAPGWPRVVIAGLHRNLSLLVIGFVAIHVLSTVLDGYAPIGLASAVIPFSSPYRVFWLGLGTVAFDLLLAVTLTSLLRDRLSYRGWRAVHWLGYACWPVALWHGLGTGTDSRLPWLLALDALCVTCVAAAIWWRLSLTGPGPGRTAAMTGTICLLAATVIFVAVGPLQPGWARRAGTPGTLLVSGARASGRLPVRAAGQT
jgi:methionine sulfoxide reductase heme-binding subunit